MTAGPVIPDQRAGGPQTPNQGSGPSPSPDGNKGDLDLLDLIAANVPQYDDPKKLMAEIEAHPFFMTEIPKDAADNPYIQALQSLAYDGEPWEVAENFKEQGNECAKAGQWKDAREYYQKGVAALRERLGEKADEVPAEGKKEGGGGKTGEEGGKKEEEEDEEEPQFTLPPPESSLSDDERAEKEKSLEISLLLNLSLANYKLSNFRSAGADATSVLAHLDPSNLKAFFRLAQAHFALGRPSSPATNPDEHLVKSLAAIENGLRAHPGNDDLAKLRADVVAEVDRRRAAKEERERAERAKREREGVLKRAFVQRGWREIRSTKPSAQSGRSSTTSSSSAAAPTARPDLEGHEISLSSPLDPASEMLLPVMVFYPTASTTDFLHSVSESATVGDVVTTVLDPLPPWATTTTTTAGTATGPGNFSIPNVDVFADISLPDGRPADPAQPAGMMKVGKKVSLAKMLTKVPVRDGLVGLYLVPGEKKDGWLEEMRKQRAAAVAAVP